MSERAYSFFGNMLCGHQTSIIHFDTKFSLHRIIRTINMLDPSFNYVMDMSATGVAVAGVAKLIRGSPFIVDTGDDIVSLGRVLGRGPIAMAATKALEAFSLRAASMIIVRGRYHQEWLRKRGIKSEFIPDGVHVDQFVPKLTPLRVPGTPLTIGVVGSSIWIPSRQMCYGWELVELVDILHSKYSLPVRGILIGDGSGIEILKKRARERAIENLIDFRGRIPFSELPHHLHEMDICLSTQTNDRIGQVRTTGKLPLYLAAGRFILASRVGEAARILPKEMLVDFAGEVDPDYPLKLANRVLELVSLSTPFAFRPECVELARQHFDYKVLSPRVASIIESVLRKR